MTKKRKTIIVGAAVLSIAALAVAALAIWLLYTHPRLLYSVAPDCVWQKHLGIYCVGCGITRAIENLLHGQLYAAFRMNPFLVGTGPFVLGALVWELTRLARKKKSIPIQPWMAWAYLAAMLAFMLLRNLPFMPFAWLAPTVV